MSTGQLVIAGLDRSPQLAEVAGEFDLEVKDVSSSFDEFKKQAEQHRPVCFLVDCTTERGKEVCLGVRMSGALADAPIVAGVRDPWSAEVREAFALGVDGYVPLSEIGHLRPKLMVLRAPDGGGPAVSHLSGKVVVADQDRERRVLLGRHLRKMGMQVEFAVEMGGIASDVGVKLVVAYLDLPPSGAVSALEAYRSGPGAKIPWVILGPQTRLEAIRAQLKEPQRLTLFDADSDPAQIVFTANQLMIGSARSMRRSPRLIHESTVQFEVVGTCCREWGYTYNISRGGLYVRTLTPPALGLDVEMEFVPPHGRGRVLVGGKVVWRQVYSGSKGYPSGFGVEYGADLPIADAAALEAGYTQLLRDNGNPEA